MATVSVLVLAFKFELRHVLGFGPFVTPAKWIAWLCLVASTLAMLIDFQLLYWAWTQRLTYGLPHAVLLILVEIRTLAPRFIWLNGSDNTKAVTFSLANAAVWLHCLLSAMYSITLNQSTQYPVTGWI